MRVGALWHCQPVPAAAPRAHARGSCPATRAGFRDRCGRVDGQRGSPCLAAAAGRPATRHRRGAPRGTRGSRCCALRPGCAATAPRAADARSLFPGTWRCQASWLPGDPECVQRVRGWVRRPTPPPAPRLLDGRANPTIDLRFSFPPASPASLL